MSLSKLPNKQESVTAKSVANRNNARLSTGPKTEAGKKRVALNARRHGLSIPIPVDPKLSQEMHALARAISNDSPGSQRYDLAINVAESQVDLTRIRQVRNAYFERRLKELDNLSVDGDWKRYETNRLVSLMRMAGTKVIKKLVDACVPPASFERRPAILSDICKFLVTIDRYERRALSRRKYAIRAFNASQTENLIAD